MKKKIIITGYPKSGNTWITRLIAELVGCPVVGFWNSSHNEIAIEGQNRISDYECYKSHHTYDELIRIGSPFFKIIYVVRDPRDIVFSGLNYFYNINPPFNLNSGFASISSIKKSINLFYRAYIGKSKMKKKMIEAVLYGNSEVHYWCRNSWEFHVNQFIENPNILIVKYEDCLLDTKVESRRILQYLEIDQSDAYIDKAIYNQSFNVVKKKFFQKGLKNQINFMRSGKSSYWTKKLTSNEKLKFKKELSIIGSKLDYDFNL